MKRLHAKILNFAILSVALPVIYGCQGGGGSAGVLDGTSIAALTTSSGGGDIATIHNPEPATMLLMAGGLAAMALYKNRNK